MKCGWVGYSINVRNQFICKINKNIFVPHTPVKLREEHPVSSSIIMLWFWPTWHEKGKRKSKNAFLFRRRLQSDSKAIKKSVCASLLAEKEIKEPHRDANKASTQQQSVSTSIWSKVWDLIAENFNAAPQISINPFDSDHHASFGASALLKALLRSARFVIYYKNINLS